MKKKMLAIFLVLSMMPAAYGYTADSYANIQSASRTGYAADNYASVQSVFGSDEPCACAGINTSWVVAMIQYCVLSIPCDLGTGNLSFAGAGNFTINALLAAKNVIYPGGNQTVWMQPAGYLKLAG